MVHYTLIGFIEARREQMEQKKQGWGKEWIEYELKKISGKALVGATDSKKKGLPERDQADLKGLRILIRFFERWQQQVLLGLL
jgi:hypothetical protein